MKDNKILRIIYLLSAVVFIAVVALYTLPQAEDIPPFVKYLPTLNASINGTCFVLLLISLYFIKSKNVQMHKRINITAFVLSALFLVSYVIFHSYGIETKYPADDPLRPVYLVILITHIILAAIVLPLVLISFYYGLKRQIPKHKKVVKWSYPIWLYVTFSGVLVYLMIRPHYPF